MREFLAVHRGMAERCHDDGIRRDLRRGGGRKNHGGGEWKAAGFSGAAVHSGDR